MLLLVLAPSFVLLRVPAAVFVIRTRARRRRCPSGSLVSILCSNSARLHSRCRVHPRSIVRLGAHPCGVAASAGNPLNFARDLRCPAHAHSGCYIHSLLSPCQCPLLLLHPPVLAGAGLLLELVPAVSLVLVLVLVLGCHLHDLVWSSLVWYSCSCLRLTVTLFQCSSAQALTPRARARIWPPFI